MLNNDHKENFAGVFSISAFFYYFVAWDGPISCPVIWMLKATKAECYWLFGMLGNAAELWCWSCSGAQKEGRVGGFVTDQTEALSSQKMGLTLALAWKSSIEASVPHLEEANAAMATTTCYFGELPGWWGEKKRMRDFPVNSKPWIKHDFEIYEIKPCSAHSLPRNWVAEEVSYA